MHFLAQVIQILAAPFVAAANFLVPAIALAGHRPVQEGDFTVAAFAVSVGFVGLLVCWWAAFTRARWANLRIDARHTESRLRGEIRLRDVLLKESEMALVVLGRNMPAPISYGDAGNLLQDCMKGPDAAVLAASLDGLLGHGSSFDCQVRNASRQSFQVRGKPVGGFAAVFFEKQQADSEMDYGAALSALPTPVWIRQNDMSLVWANRSFLDVVQVKTLEAAIRSNVFVDRSEHDLALGARDGAPVTGVRRFTSVAGRRRALSISLSKMPDATVLGMAVDVTDAVQAEAKLKMHVDAYAGLLDRIPAAIANFDADKRLTHYNSAYAQLWCLSDEWLRTHPSIDEILDRLRDSGKLPEQRDFRAWKQEHLRPFRDTTRYTEEVWHTANEKSIEVQAQPDLEGGVFYIFADVSERMRLTSKLALLGRVQRATLDTLDEGIAIFEPNGRLATHNTAFLQSWHLKEAELAEGPHFTQLAALCVSRKGRDAIWDIVSAALSSGEIEGYAEWGKVTRADGRIIAVSLSHLPNGAIVVMFKDLTDMERFSEAFKEIAPAAA